MAAAQQAAATAAPPPPQQAAALQAQAALPAAEQPMPGKCHFFLEKKRRHCKFDAVPGKAYCGNHLYEGEGVGPKRVPCPWDPKGGHTVLESELERHKNKCPGYLQRLAQQEQPCFAEDINAGPGLEVEWPAGLQPLPAPAQLTQHTSGADAAADAGATDGSSIRKRQRRQRPAQGASLVQAAYAAAMGEQRFMQLLQRVETACEQVCEAEPLSLALPPEAEPFLAPESATCNRPFSLKHAQQQASIVGNMKQRGLLAGAAGVAYVEYGAGKGYLSHMLSLCCPEARKVVMMDVRGFKEKADRSMRHLDMQRLRCDIKDFDVGKVPGLDSNGPWVALGKHLCGAATDFTLRSCARERQRQAGREGQPQGGVRGLAVATCCHHRCSWRHFVAQDVMLQLGFSPQEFEVIVWMTGWALCGHEAPAGFGGSDCEEADEGTAEQQHHSDGEQQPGSSAATQSQARHKRGRDGASAPPSPTALGAAAAAAEGTPAAGAAAEAAAAACAAAAGDDWRPQRALTREQKIAVGRRCKRLIDAARLRWLRRQGFEASLVKYVPSEVSGENRLLLATAAAAAQ